MKLVWRNGLIAAALIGTAVLSQSLKPGTSIEETARVTVPLERFFPAAFGGWHLDPVASGLVRPAFEAAGTFQMYDQVLERIYVDDRGRRIMLSAAYGRLQSVGLQMHRPEVCYKAGGFDVSDVAPGQVGLPQGAQLPVTRLIASMPGRHEPVTYWRLLGAHVARDDTQFRWMQFKLGVQRALPDGLLVRVSSLDEQPKRAYGMHDAFIADLAASLQGEARSRLMGDVLSP
jgi:EpsI family protein